MTILIIGLVLFLGTHLVPVLTRLRSRLFLALGENKYKALFSLVAAIGLVLIVIGFRRAPADIRWFEGFPVAIAIAPAAMLVSFVLFVSSNMRAHIRTWLQHPQLIAVGIWALVHLLANGDARGTILFGSFLAFVVIDLVSAIRRHAVKRFEPVWKYDAIALVVGIVAAILVMTFHPQIFGVPALSSHA